MMFRTQVYLTTTERDELNMLSLELHRPKSELIREAIDQFIESKRTKKRDKRAAMKAAAGLWAGRDDLDFISELRQEFDRGYDYGG